MRRGGRKEETLGFIWVGRCGVGREKNSQNYLSR
jgi:hypothetical protein